MLITGGIAAHKTPSICSALSIHGGHEVHLMTTRNALKFVTKDSLMYAITKWWNDEYMSHIKAIDDVKIDKLIVVPATANIIGKIANGIGDDEVSTTCLKCPSKITKIIFPAMNPDMWNNSIVQENIEKLLYHGWCIVDPEYGKMACGVFGKGILPNTKYIVNCIENIECKRDVIINSEIDNNLWYKQYSDKRFRLQNNETDDYYYVCNDDNKINPPLQFYPIYKKDCKIVYLTHLNRFTGKL